MTSHFHEDDDGLACKDFTHAKRSIIEKLGPHTAPDMVRIRYDQIAYIAMKKIPWDFVDDIFVS